MKLWMKKHKKHHSHFHKSHSSAFEKCNQEQNNVLHIFQTTFYEVYIIKAPPLMSIICLVITRNVFSLCCTQHSDTARCVAWCAADYMHRLVGNSSASASCARNFARASVTIATSQSTVQKLVRMPKAKKEATSTPEEVRGSLWTCTLIDCLFSSSISNTRCISRPHSENLIDF